MESPHPPLTMPPRSKKHGRAHISSCISLKLHELNLTGSTSDTGIIHWTKVPNAHPGLHGGVCEFQKESKGAELLASNPCSKRVYALHQY